MAMANNNSVTNGRVQQASSVPQRQIHERTKKGICAYNTESAFSQFILMKNNNQVPDIPPIENRNWLLYRHYVRHEYKICQKLIEEELAKSYNHNEYANYLKV